MTNCNYEFAGWTKFIKESEIRRLLTVKVDYAFGGGMPAALPLDVFAEILTEMGSSFTADINAGKGMETVYPLMNYGQTAGLEPFRRTLAERLIRRDRLDWMDIETGWQNVFISTGSQQALFLLLDTFLDPGDILATPAPSYLGFLGPAQKLKAEIVTVPTDMEGIIPEAVQGTIDKCKEKFGRAPKLLYTVPDSDNPKGTMLPEKRRKEIFDICVAENVVILEDAAYKEMSFDGSRIHPIKHWDTENEHVCFLSTTSKEAAVLRLGYSVLPPAIFNQMAKAKGYLDLCTPSLNQEILDIYYTKYMDKSLPKTRAVYRERGEAMIKAFDEHMSDCAVRTDPKGGFFVWAEIKDKNFDAAKFLEEVAIPNSILYVPGAAFYPMKGPKYNSYNLESNSIIPGEPEVNTMRINFSAPSVQQIEDGISLLGKLICKK
ncbi:MAG: aminotransferase-like domain-containing protein [Candidatus Kariarchaeaceae archaeon]